MAIDREAFELAARLAAIEHLMADLYRLVYAATRLTPEQIKTRHSKALEAARKASWPTKDAGHTALASGAFEDALTRLLEIVEVTALPAQSGKP